MASRFCHRFLYQIAPACASWRMALYDKDNLPTRASLLRRVKNVQDQKSWEEFDAIYRKLIYGFAIKSGLTHEEAEDAVQETFAKLTEQLPEFEYDPERGSFKNWLRRVAHAQVVAQFRRRFKAGPPAPPRPGETTRTSTLQRAPDPSGPELERIWDEEWGAYLIRAAEDKVKRLVDPLQFQIYDLYVKKGWPSEKVAEMFSVPVGQVYMAKHRITELLRDKLQLLESKAA